MVTTLPNEWSTGAYPGQSRIPLEFILSWTVNHPCPRTELVAGYMLTQTQQRQIGNAERVHDTAPPVSFSCNFMYVYFSEHMDINRSGESDYQMVPKRDESSIHNNPSDLMRRCWQEEPKRTEWLLDWYCISKSDDVAEGKCVGREWGRSDSVGLTFS